MKRTCSSVCVCVHEQCRLLKDPLFFFFLLEWIPRQCLWNQGGSSTGTCTHIHSQGPVCAQHTNCSVLLGAEKIHTASPHHHHHHHQLLCSLWSLLFLSLPNETHVVPQASRHRYRIPEVSLPTSITLLNLNNKTSKSFLMPQLFLEGIRGKCYFHYSHWQLFSYILLKPKNVFLSWQTCHSSVFQ